MTKIHHWSARRSGDAITITGADVHGAAITVTGVTVIERHSSEQPSNPVAVDKANQRWELV